MGPIKRASSSNHYLSAWFYLAILCLFAVKVINNRVLVEGGMFHGSLGTWQFIKWQNGKKENKLWALLKKCQPWFNFIPFLYHTHTNTSRGSAHYANCMKIHISSSPKLICHCLLLVSQTGQKTGMKLRGPKCLRVCVCGPRFCGLHFYHSFAARVLWGVTFGPGCLLINDRQDKHANNLIKFAVNNKIPTHITWPNFNRALIKC